MIGHLTDENGDIIGQPNEDPNLNTVMYEVEFPDGTRQPIAANTIAQEIYSQVDADGRRDVVVEEIIDYCRDLKYAVPKSNQYFYHNGQKCQRKTTSGWKILTRLKD